MPPYWQASGFHDGKPDLIMVMMEKNPNTPAVPSAKINPSTFLFFKELIKPNTARIATRLKMITVPIYSELPSDDDKEKSMYEATTLYILKLFQALVEFQK